MGMAMLCGGRRCLRNAVRGAMRWRPTARGHGWLECTAEKLGTLPDFTYSIGVKNLGVTWNDATLEKWLSDPEMVVKDNNMSFSVPKAEERRDLIAFLKH